MSRKGSETWGTPIVSGWENRRSLHAHSIRFANRRLGRDDRTGMEDLTGMGVCIGDLMAMAELQEWRARDAAWWAGLTRKRRGEMAEAAFLHKASRMGFGVSRPWGDSEPYDLIVDSGKKLWRVQVKSASHVNKWGGYMVRATGNDTRKKYSLEEIDVLVAYIVPEDLWYVIPVTLFRTIKGVKLYPAPRRRRSKYEVYREAWCWLGEGGENVEVKTENYSAGRIREEP
jgi:hypothetical protein